VKNLFCIIVLLFSLSAIADDTTIFDFTACGVLLVELNDPQLDILAMKSLERGITTEQLFNQLPVHVEIIRAIGKDAYALKAQESCRILGITVDLSQLTT